MPEPPVPAKNGMVKVPHTRRRVVAALLVPAVIAAGLLSRRSADLHALAGKYPGDALWTAMVYLLVVALAPGLRRLRVAAIALAISWLVEFSQLLQYSWLERIRETTPGHLVLGTTFHSPDLVAYAVGAALACLLDGALTPTQSGEGPEA